jgi:hypothetical protein
VRHSGVFDEVLQVRTAIITVNCDVIEVGRGNTVTTRSCIRKFAIPLDVPTREGMRAFGKELALAIREAAYFVGVTPNEMLLAVLASIRSETEKITVALDATSLEG